MFKKFMVCVVSDDVRERSAHVLLSKKNQNLGNFSFSIISLSSPSLLLLPYFPSNPHRLHHPPIHSPRFPFLLFGGVCVETQGVLLVAEQS